MELKTLLIVMGIIFIHWIADFVCQPEQVAIGKSKSWNYLIEHVSSYSIVWFVISILGIGFKLLPGGLLLFAPITFCLHLATDYYTSRVHSQLWEDKKTHDFFVSIGFDQLLHYTQLLFTYYLLTK